MRWNIGNFGQFGSAYRKAEEEAFWADEAESGTLTCPTSYRLKTEEELAARGLQFHGDLRPFAGQLVQLKACAPDSTLLTVMVGGRDFLLDRDDLVIEVGHTFVETGCSKSWCSICDHEGRFEFASGKFKPL